MAHNLTTQAPGKSAMRPKNRVLGFSAKRCIYPLGTRRQRPELRSKPCPTPTFSTPGIPQWPTRDPIGEWGGANLYGFVGNNGVEKVDVLGAMFGDAWGAYLREKAKQEVAARAEAEAKNARDEIEGRPLPQGVQNEGNCFYVWVAILRPDEGKKAIPRHVSFGMRPAGSMDKVNIAGTRQEGDWENSMTYDPKTGQNANSDKQGKIYECCCLSDQDFKEMSARFNYLKDDRIPEGASKGKKLQRGLLGYVADSPSGIPYNCGTAVSIIIHNLGGTGINNIWDSKPDDLPKDDAGQDFFNPVLYIYNQMETQVKEGRCRIVYNGVPDGNKYK